MCRKLPVIKSEIVGDRRGKSRALAICYSCQVLTFVRGPRRKLIRERRKHIECESRPDLGCLVLGTVFCTRRPNRWQRWRHKLKSKVVIEAWLLSLVVVPLVCSWMWIVELIGSSRGEAQAQNEA